MQCLKVNSIPRLLRGSSGTRDQRQALQPTGQRRSLETISPGELVRRSCLRLRTPFRERTQHSSTSEFPPRIMWGEAPPTVGSSGRTNVYTLELWEKTGVHIAQVPYIAPACFHVYWNACMDSCCKGCNEMPD